MKLKRFNESLNNEIDIEYINNCFIDTIDNGFKVFIDRDIDDEADEDLTTCIVTIWMSNLKSYREEKNIESIIVDFDKVSEMTKDIKVSIDKVKIEYPDINVNIYMEPSKIEIVFSVTERN
jgi:thermostable 8-oxoguanine DNA glycosylase